MEAASGEPPSAPGTEADTLDTWLLVLVIVIAVVACICCFFCVSRARLREQIRTLIRRNLGLSLAELEAKAEREKVAEARVEAAMKAATAVITKAATENRVAEKAAAFGLLQPLKALSLEADTLYRVLAAAVAYCDAQGAASFADLVERTSRLIAHQHDRRF